MDIQIVMKQPLKLIGIGWTGPYSQVNEIPQLFARFAARENEIVNQIGNTYICPFHDRKTDFTYYVTVAVDSFDHVPEGMVSLELPEQKYAFASYHGPEKQVEKAYINIFRWLRENGYEKDYSALSLEIYHEEDEEVNRSDNERKFDIYVPVKSEINN
jgi:AraC family transcriptional regulator